MLVFMLKDKSSAMQFRNSEIDCCSAGGVFFPHMQGFGEN